MSINIANALSARLPVPPLPDLMLEPLVRSALLEDLGRAGDLTTDAVSYTHLTLPTNREV